MNYKIVPLISEEEVNKRIGEIAQCISRDYAGQDLHVICVLKGGAFFMCELAKRIDPGINVTLDFMAASSYGSGTDSSGIVKIIKDLDESIEGRNVIIAEDIIDSGRTLKSLTELLWSRKPDSLEVCTLLDKPSRRVVDMNVKYACFTVPDQFVVGYGLDYDQKYRNLPYIGTVEFERKEDFK